MWLAILLLGTGAWLAHVNLQRVAAGDVIADQVHSAELASETVLATLTDAETGQRGYLLTGDPDYLAPYQAARARLDQDFARLEQAPLISKPRERLVEQIQALSALKLAELDRTIALYRSGQPDAALALVRTNQGKQTMDLIRNNIAALQADVVTRQHDVRARDTANSAWLAVIGMGITASVLLGGVALAQSRARVRLTDSLYRLDRFTRAFSLTQGMMRDLDGRITVWSAGAERLYGYTAALALGRISHDLLKTCFPQPLADIQAALLRDGHWQGELAHIRQDGTQAFVASFWTLHHGEAGETDAVIEINNDITDLKQADAGLRESELKLRLALDATSQGIWRWEVGTEPPAMIWDSRCRALFGVAADSAVNYETWIEAVPSYERKSAEQAIMRALDPADPHDDYVGEHPVFAHDGELRWVAAMGRALFDPDPSAASGRRAARILGTVRDVSKSKRIAVEQKRAAALLATIIETAPALIYAKDLHGKMLLANAPVIALIGKTWDQVEGRLDSEFLNDSEQGKAVMLNDRRVMEQGQAETLEERVSGPDGRDHIWFSTKAPMRGADGAVIGLVGISVDITEQKEAQDRLRLMLNELNHRVKNTLATVQALVSQTLRGLDPALRRTLESRLLALASAHDLLTRESWQRGTLQDVVTEALAPFDGWDAARFWISGPPVFLRPTAVLAMAMGLHELATNALKFGALSLPSGRVEIRWEVTDDDAQWLHFVWTERNGPAVAPPAQRGFGTRLVERTLAQDLRGTTEIRFDDPRGVVCRIQVPLADVTATAGTVSFPRVGGL